MQSSLARNFLLGVALTSIVFTITASLSAFFVFQRELAHRQVGFLSQYVQERTNNLDRRFTGLLTLHRSAVATLQSREALMKPTEADALLRRQFPMRPDGTRRSRPEDYTGHVSREGRLIYGMGAFIADGAHVPQVEARALTSAYTIVGAFGQAAHGDYDNFYFFTPHNRLVMFGPNRPDHLLFYRERAPANFDYSGEEMNRIVLPSANPHAETRCTSLQRLLQYKAGARVGTACVTPAYVDGRFVGAFGSTINVTDFFADAVRDTLPGTSSLILRGDGALLAFPGSVSAAGASESQVADFGRRLHLSVLTRELKQAHGRYGVVVSPDGKQIIAYGRLSGPGWYYLMSYPAGAVAWSAARSASVVLVLGLLASLLQTLAILRMARRAITRPLQALAQTCEQRCSPTAVPLERRSDEIGVLARALRDERDRADELLTSLEQRVSERTAELEKANDEKSRFLANMSHELRTPLNGVIAISETLAREQVSPRNIELAQLIVASGRLLEQVLTDILDFSKIEAGEMRLERQPFDLATVTARVAELHHASAAAKGVQLHWEVEAAAQGTYLGDSIRLTQVLSNLLSNAVKFTAEGRVTLTVERVGNAVRFEITDTGIGFDDAAKARLFQRFEQADISIRRRFGGTGLGLAICQSLVALMSGEIEARSTPGEGATFTVLAPLERAAAPAAETPVHQDIADLPGLRVLLAEDHPTNQRVVRLILEAVGAEMTVVENGALALEAFAAQRFDIVLMDMQMPEMDGLTATARLRAMEREMGAARIPVIMLTANALDEHVRASLTAGADLHLSKPLRANDLLEAVAALTSGDETGVDLAALSAA